MRIILLFLLLPLFSFGQKDTLVVSLDNGLTSVYNKNSNNNGQVNLAFNGDNMLALNKFKINSNTNYSLAFQDFINSNEFIQKTNIGYSNFFLSHVYNYSLVRSIYSDNSFGVGYGIKKIFGKFTFSLSYAILYQNIKSSKSNIEMARSSLRLKIKYPGKHINISTEYYYQPNWKNINDCIVYGNTKITFFPEKSLNFIVQDAINYRSLSSIKMLHNITFGIGYSFDKKIKIKQ